MPHRHAFANVGTDSCVDPPPTAAPQFTFKSLSTEVSLTLIPTHAIQPTEVFGIQDTLTAVTIPLRSSSNHLCWFFAYVGQSPVATCAAAALNGTLAAIAPNGVECGALGSTKLAMKHLEKLNAAVIECDGLSEVGISTTTMLTLISNCSAGRYAKVKQNLNPMINFPEQYNCTGCKQGKYGNVPRSESFEVGCAHNCSSGRYSTKTGLSADESCAPCPSGKFGAGTGLTSELAACPGACPAGKHGTGEGLTSEVVAEDPTFAPTFAPTLAPTVYDGVPTALPTSAPTSAPTVVPVLTYTNTSECTYDAGSINCCGLAQIIIIDATVTAIKAKAFFSCSLVTSIDFSSAASLLTIGDMAFSRMNELESVDMGGATQLLTIGSSAFQFNAKLVALNISNTTVAIGSSAFQSTGVSSLLDVNFNGLDCASVTELNSFQFSCPPSPPYVYTSASTCTYQNNNNKQCCAGSLIVVVDSTVVTIADGAFSYCNSVVAVNFTGATALTSIGSSGTINGAMESMAALTSIDMSGATNLSAISSYSFYDCLNLESVTLSSTITTIETGAFGWTKIDSMAKVVWNGVACSTHVGNMPFSSCTRRRLLAPVRTLRRRRLLKATNAPTVAPTLGENETSAPTASPLPPTMAFGITHAPTSAPTAAPPPGCVYCDLGKFSPYAGQAVCGGLCPVGRFGNKSGATAEAETCMPCSPGLYANMGSGTCEQCPRGFVPNKEQSACVLCAGNTYASDDGLSCTPCGLEGQDCSYGVLKLMPGWFYDLAREKRLYGKGLSSETDMFPCFEPDHCTVANKTTLVCGANSGGPLCAVCNSGFVPDKSTIDGSCKVCSQSPNERWANKFVIIIIGAACFFAVAFFQVTRPKPQLLMSKFLDIIIFRMNLRRARKRAIERMFERDQADGEKPTLNEMQVEDFRALIKAGRYDDVQTVRQSIYAASSAGLALETVLGGSTTGGAGIGGASSFAALLSAHGEEQAEHLARMGGERALGVVHDLFGAPQNPDEQMRGLRAGGGGEGIADGVMLGEARDAVVAGAAGARDVMSVLMTFFQDAKEMLLFVIETASEAISPGQLKVLMGNLQINASFTVVFEIPWPKGFTNLLGYMNMCVCVLCEEGGGYSPLTSPPPPHPTFSHITN